MMTHLKGSFYLLHPPAGASFGAYRRGELKFGPVRGGMEQTPAAGGEAPLGGWKRGYLVTEQAAGVAAPREPAGAPVDVAQAR
jgi:hypothetical protein